MLQINLLPVREARRKADIRQIFMQLVLLVLLALAVVGVVHSRITDDLTSAKNRVDQMNRDIDQFKPQLEQVAKFRKQKKQLEKKIHVIDKLDQARSGPVRMLSELAARTPERLWLTSLKTSGSTISMKGHSLDNEIVAHFLRDLGRSPYFKQVDLDSTELGAQKRGLRVVTFNIRATLVGPKKPDKLTKAKKDA
jgi:type IV pilus assembly protein PilN